MKNKLFIYIIFLLTTIVSVSALTLNINTCGLYDTNSYDTYNLTNNINFAGSGVNDACLIMNDLTDFTFKGNGFTINSTTGNGRGLLFDKIERATFNNIKFSNSQNGMSTTFYTSMAIGGKANHVCENVNVTISNIYTDNVQYPIFFSCAYDTENGITPTLIHSSTNINIINITEINGGYANGAYPITNSKTFFDAVNNLYFENLHFENMSAGAFSYAKFEFEFSENVTGHTFSALNTVGNNFLSILSNTSNVVLAGFTGFNADFGMSIVSANIKNVDISNMNFNQSFNFTGGRSAVITHIININQNGLNLSNNITYRNAIISSGRTSSFGILLGRNGINITLQNYTFNDYISNSTSPFLSMAATASENTINRNVLVKDLFLNNITKNNVELIQITSRNNILDNIVLNGIYINTGINQSLQPAMTIIKLNTVQTSPFAINNRLLNINIPPIANANMTVGIYNINDTNTYYENVTNLRNYFYDNLFSCSVSPCVPFKMRFTSATHINSSSKNNIGWFPQNITRAFPTTTSNNITDIAMFNVTDGTVTSSATPPYNYFNNQTFRLFNNDIGYLPYNYYINITYPSNNTIVNTSTINVTFIADSNANPFDIYGQVNGGGYSLITNTWLNYYNLFNLTSGINVIALKLTVNSIDSFASVTVNYTPSTPSCTENWVPYYQPLGCWFYPNGTENTPSYANLNQSISLLYNDTNNCGTTNNLPVENGTTNSCPYYYLSNANVDVNNLSFTFNSNYLALLMTVQLYNGTNEQPRVDITCANNYTCSGVFTNLPNEVYHLASFIDYTDFGNATIDVTKLMYYTLQQEIPLFDTFNISICTPDWVQNNTPCINDTYFINFYDVNNCNNISGLPITNGTELSCAQKPPYQINNPNTEVVIQILVFFVILSLLAGIGFMFFKNTEFVEKNLAIIIVGVIVLVMIFVLITIFL